MHELHDRATENVAWYGGSIFVGFDGGTVNLGLIQI